MPFQHAKATLRTAGEHNRRMVFEILRRCRRTSRQQIADMTELHRSTLSKIMGEFLAGGLVREVGFAAAAVRRVGKRRTLVEIRGDAAWTLGFGLSPGWGRMVVVDAAGEVLSDSRAPIAMDIAAIPAQLKAHFDERLSGDARPPGPLLGVGVGVPGIVDPAAGVLIYSDPFKVRNHRLAEAVRHVFGVPTAIDNDARLETLAHLKQPGERGGSDFVFLYVNHRDEEGRVALCDFGSAVVLGGRLYRGAHHGAGEMWGRLRPAAMPSLWAEDIELIENPQGAMNARLEALAEALAPYVATLAGYIDPEAIVMGGSLDWRNEAFRRHLEARVNEQTQPWFAGRNIRIECAAVPAGAAYGAALMAFDQTPFAKILARPARRRGGSGGR